MSKKPRRKRGYRTLQAFVGDSLCTVCGKEYDPYQDLVLDPHTRTVEGDITQLYYTFIHERCIPNTHWSKQKTPRKPPTYYGGPYGPLPEDEWMKLHE